MSVVDQFQLVAEFDQHRLYAKHQLNVVNLQQNHGLVTRQEFLGALKNQLLALHVSLHNQRGIVFELERIQGNSWNRPTDEIRIVAGFPRWLCKFQKRTTTHSALDVMAQDKIHLAVPCRDGNRQDLDAPGQLGIEFKITARRSRLKGFGSKADKLPPGSEWLHEIKHDGFRVIARKEGAKVRLYSEASGDLPDPLPPRRPP